MKMGFKQLVCLVSGVFFLALGAGLVGGRLVVQKRQASGPELPVETTANSGRLRAEKPPVSSWTGTIRPAPGDDVSPVEPAAEEKDQPVPASRVSERATAPAAKESSSVPPVRYVIQATATSNHEDARAARAKIMAEGFPVGIFEVNLDEKGKWYRVQVGPYESEAEARRALGPVRKIEGFEKSYVRVRE